MIGDLGKLRQRIDAGLSRLALARKSFFREKAELIDARTHKANVEEALTLTQRVAQELQETAHKRIATIVSEAIAAVFADDPEGSYEFKILFERKRNRTEARIAFFRDGKELDPIDDVGGGVLEVASFALRLSALLLANPPTRKIVVLDEPLAQLSREYQPVAAQLIERLSKELGVQILMVTHVPVLRIGTVVEVN